MPAPASKPSSRLPWEAKIRWQRHFVEVAVKRDEKAAATEAGASNPQEMKEASDEIELMTVWYRVVDFVRSADERVRFRVNRDRSGRVTFTDTRERKTGIAGVTGIWGTLPPPRPIRPRSMTPTAFKTRSRPVRRTGKGRGDCAAAFGLDVVGW